MNDSSGKRGERRTGTQDMIRKLLEERQQMLVLFCRVSGLEPYTGEKPVRDTLNDFCQILMDYMAFGHFELYQRITEGNERRFRVIESAEHIYPRVAEATEVAVAFNDRYDATRSPAPLNALPQDLSRLGQALAVRIELEDQLLQALLA